MKNVPSVFFLMGFLLFSSCNTDSLKGDGNIVKEQRTTTAFSKIEIDGGYELIVSQGNNESVAVEADKNLLERITTSVSGDKLNISVNGSIYPSRKVKVYVTLINFSSLECNGSVQITCATPFHVDKFKLESNGSASGKLDIFATSLEAESAGSSEMIFTGKTQKSKYEIAGSGKIMALDMISEDCEIDISGSGSVSVNATSKLDIDIAGSGDVKYTGTATVKQSVAGSGSVQKL